jgi:hypothetical protein
MVGITDLNKRGIYEDLLNEFLDRGHEVTIVSPLERRTKKPTTIKKTGKTTLLNVATFNLTQTNLIEKGLGIVLLESQFLKAIKKHFADIAFDLILYSTPPITFFKVIEFIKNRDGAYTYLLLKDIFPQNAVDMGFIKKGGLLHRYFAKKEKQLYRISNTIGCMSEANRVFLLTHNPFVSHSKVEVNPNSIKPRFIRYDNETITFIREKYDLPLHKKIFVYGGNLGIPQGIDFLLKTIETLRDPRAHFLIVGHGTEYKRIAGWFEVNKPQQATLLSGLPKQDYDALLASCDVGLIFLHKNFTIPNFPSRLLSYLEMKKPVLAATDVNTDIGKIIENASCGFWVEAGNLQQIHHKIEQLCAIDTTILGENGWILLQGKYLVSQSCALIEEKVR